MRSKKIWINLSITNLCLVAALGVLMRSKIIFDLPWIDYNRLVDTHGHFAFAGWATLVLITLMVYELPGALYSKSKYQVLLGAIFICSWLTLFTSPFEKFKNLTEYVSFIYILVTYIFFGVFTRDILKTTANKTVKLLSISALLYQVLSSAGAIMLACLFAMKSLNAILYRDALFGYLHMQYNGFFTLAVFALIFNKVVPVKGNEKAMKSFHWFGILLSLSIIPSMFLTFLWHKITPVFHIISAIGGVMLLSSFISFVFAAPFLLKEFKMVKPAIRYMIILSITAFLIKILMQSLTFVDSINVLVFGNRPMIMGFLHLIFLGFVTLFVMTYFSQRGYLDVKSKFTRFALMVFTIAILINETLLMLQGLGNMFLTSSPLFPWYLWGAGILLLAGTILIAGARIRTKQI